MRSFKTLKAIISVFLCLCFAAGCGTAEENSSVPSYTSVENEISSTEDTSSEEPVSSEEETVSSIAEVSSDVSVPAVSTAPKPSVSKPTVAPPKPPVPVKQVQYTDGNEMRAVWISFLEFKELLMDKTQREFTDNIAECFNKCVDMGFNTVIVHARSHGDAYYESKYFPGSVYFTNHRSYEFPFDPLEIMVAEAHKRGLKIEAWINPYRCNKTSEGFATNGDDIVKRLHAEGKAFICKTDNSYYFLNPAEPDVRRLVVDGVIEIVENYDIDGVHFDDYFYPTTDPSVDTAAYEKYGNGRELNKFRRDCVNELIGAVYKEIKKRKNIPFGISPAGNIDNCIDMHYADVMLWGSSEGYVDYLAPQLYWDYGEGSLPYEKALETWKTVVKNKNVKLMAGLGAYRVTENKGDFWKSGDVLKKQVTDARVLENYGGFIVFRYDFYIDSKLKAERDSLKSILK